MRQVRNEKLQDPKDSIIRFSVSLPSGLLDELDNKITQNGYTSRSELIRDMIREKLVDEKWDKGESEGTKEHLGVLVLIYDHHQRGLNQKKNEIEHNNHLVQIVCTTHVHVDHHNCLETIILKGKKDDIEKLCIEIGGLLGVKFAKLTRTASFREQM
ncbi:nickel-responsive transcriptional regulator NikR [Helicobacter trogontum]|uniref:Putative nickel-responsive regulator n=1 Tax=Helicobacter trogontum TaxID=50960 RepID=A0A4U8SAI8_9HELI|nr:nickel-responsive transcriptional regulator NikR [Helicobacter trogontum]MCI5786954.1 nickel-responsive transcriptional regulator NikR [Helicobacter trogontum]MDY5185185.1 nickel-responsive transcriptional regulator NikR [Helicobacter trogontum]TLD83040.1 nickel-responsive transcriptional regulator NikR [Helicobacter trogontum]